MAIPTKIIRNLDQENVIRTMAIDLSDNEEDRQAIIEVLRSKLYSNKKLAPIREYATNAFDSHVEAGVSDTPISITLPTQIFPEFRVRDFGIGLTPDEVEKIYIKYGRSTKRNTNGQTGQLGLGCKSAFAYGDNFVVVSYKDGVKTTYNLTINGVCTVFASEPMEPGESNGIEVMVPVAQEDVRDFQNEAINFFKYWKLCPELKGGDVGKLDTLRNELSIKPIFCGDDWEIRPAGGYGEDRGIAVMGNVPYPINWSLISEKMNISYNDKDYILFEFIRANKTILRFNIGDLDFSASRESLEYTEKTCREVVEKVRSILGNIFSILDAKINAASSYWEALLIYNQIFGNGDDKIFSGDLYKLEKYYEGKFSWQGNEIETGAFTGMDHWDQELGYSATGVWKKDGVAFASSNPVMSVFTKRADRLKQARSSETCNNRIPASNRVKIVIHDLEKPVYIKASVRYVFNSNPTTPPSKVFLLRFKDDAQLKEFIKANHFEGVPVIYVSSIVGKIKEELKQGRASSGGQSIARDPQQVRFFSPRNRKDSYGRFNDIDWDRQEVDLREEEGIYVEVSDGHARVNDNTVYNLSNLSHYTKVICDALGEEVPVVYGLMEKNFNAKWFKKAVTEGQWTKLDDFVKGKQDLVLRGKAFMVAMASKYFQTSGHENHLGIYFAEQILPKLNNKNGAMYKACVEITSDFRKMVDLVDAIKFFKMGDDVAMDCETNFEELFQNVRKAYPMIIQHNSVRYIQSDAKDSQGGNYLTSDVINTVAQYVNFIDLYSTDSK